MSPLRVLALTAVAAGTGSAAWLLVSTAEELATLRRILRSIVPNGRIERTGDLVALKRYLNASVSYEGLTTSMRRPFLRARAVETLASGRGFCGENARVAVLLLQLGGLRANRLYMQGDRFEHCAVEHLWNGEWKLFDGHADPLTMMSEEQLGTLSSDEPGSFPNGYPDSAWLRSLRLRPLRKIAPLKRFMRARLPSAAAFALELPSLIMAGGAAIVVSGGVLLWKLAK